MRGRAAPPPPLGPCTAQGLPSNAKVTVFEHAHPSAQQWIEAVGRPAWDAALTVTVVRSPWSRLVSLFEQDVALCAAARLPSPLPTVTVV